MRPIVFLTDYGLGDEFVGVCHGVMERIAPGVRVIDLTHAIPRGDVVQGALTLGRAVRFMPEDAVHLAVVDPGVGSDRRAIAIECGSGAVLVGPDNGLLSMAWDELGGPRFAAEITSPAVHLEPVSETFHGRDVFAPAAAHLARGMAVGDLGPFLEPEGLHTVELPGPMVAPGVLGARVVAIDGFGNVQLNVTPEDLEAAGLSDAVQIGARVVPRVGTFADARSGSPVAFIDSQGYLALAVNGGSAAQAFGLSRGDAVVLSPPDEGSGRAGSDRARP
jgi:S-adenosyl-L-methionine hydrolase (adenosine-forming)